MKMIVNRKGYLMMNLLMMGEFQHYLKLEKMVTIPLSKHRKNKTLLSIPKNLRM